MFKSSQLTIFLKKKHWWLEKLLHTNKLRLSHIGLLLFTIVNKIV